MDQVFASLISVMRSVPVPVIYLIAALWLGLESAGIGVPIEPMMLFVGSLASKSVGIVNPVLAVVACTVGCILFALLAYAIGRRVGTAAITRIGRYIGLTEVRADHVEVWVRRKGAVGVFVARLTPIVRTFGSFVMGAAEIPVPTFVLGTLLGSALYCSIFVTIGAILGYEIPLRALDFVGWRGIAVVVAIVLIYAALHFFWGRLTLRRIRAHYHLHHKAEMATVAPTTTPTA